MAPLKTDQPAAATGLVYAVHFKQGRRGRKELHLGRTEPQSAVNQGRIPRISRLMALAIHLEGLLHDRSIRDCAAAARLGGVSRARVSQIMGLLNLAPDIQESLLTLPMVEGGRDPISERDVRPLFQIPGWREQRTAWGAIRAAKLMSR